MIGAGLGLGTDDGKLCAVPRHTHPFPFLFEAGGMVGLVGDTLQEGGGLVQDTLGVNNGYDDDPVTVGITRPAPRFLLAWPLIL